jgi:hypothetical protein
MTQIAIVLVLLTPAGLLLESFRRLLGQELGYQPRSVVALDIGSWGFDTNGDVCMYRTCERLRAPGVEAVGTVSAPLTGKWTFDEGRWRQFVPRLTGRRSRRLVAFDYFQVMGSRW